MLQRTNCWVQVDGMQMVGLEGNMPCPCRAQLQMQAAKECLHRATGAVVATLEVILLAMGLLS